MANPLTPLRFAALMGALAVALGAFGAHALRHILIELGALTTWQTASTYHLIHAVALLALALKMPRGPYEYFQSTKKRPSALTISFIAFSAGIVLFSGSLYALALTQIKPLAWLTPMGGLCFLVGWIALFFYSDIN